MIIKVCGVTSAEVAKVAIDAGADWIGLVFVPDSVRKVDHSQAQAVAEAVAGRVDLVGVLVSPAPADCDRLADCYGLAAVQVHGEVDPLLVDKCSVPVIRAINPRSRHEALTAIWWPDLLLHLDGAPGDPSALPGGTGNALPREWASVVARHRRIVLSGGLSPENVARAIADVRPAGVDASSALESAPGVKDPRLVERFVRQARAAA